MGQRIALVGQQVEGIVEHAGVADNASQRVEKCAVHWSAVSIAGAQSEVVSPNRDHESTKLSKNREEEFVT